MDYQEPIPPTPVTTQNQDQKTPSNTVWYVVVAIIVVATIASFWYYSSVPVAQPTAIEQTTQDQASSLSSGNTTADISADFDQISDDSALLDQEAAVSAQDVSSL